MRRGPGDENVRFVVESENQTDNRLRQGWIRSILILAHPSITPSRRTFLVYGHSLAKQSNCSIPGDACQARFLGFFELLRFDTSGEERALTFHRR
jgi:hypothetical protein